MVKWAERTFDPHHASLFILIRHLKLVNDVCDVLWSHVDHLQRRTDERNTLKDL